MDVVSYDLWTRVSLKRRDVIVLWHVVDVSRVEDKFILYHYLVRVWNDVSI